MFNDMDAKVFALDLAHRAGAIIKKNFMLGMKKEWKIDELHDSPVTKTDVAINRLVVDGVKKEFPSHSILGEEESELSGTGEYVWVCDPIDGTKAFSHAIPTCVFSLALTRRGKSITGVIYDPFMDRMFFAQHGKGATMNGQKISVSSRDTIKNSLFGVCSGWKDAPCDFSPVSAALKRENAEVIDVGSITYMGALVAAGEFGGTMFQGTKPYDTAALKVIVEEAGGKVTDLFGNDQRYDRDIKGHIISNGILHGVLLDMIRSARK